MSLIKILFFLLIYPLQLIFEIVFNISNNHVSNPGFAIVILSLVVNFLVLPLYRSADSIQKEERELEARMADGVAHIKKTFTGDERFMMLQTYYRQNGYNPVMSLRSSIPLLLQIPFFIAAYRLLSNLTLLNGVSFGIISNLGVPDSIIRLGSISINLLPVLMTAINIISGIIYTKGHPVKEKIQINTMAVLFLILLYNSPSGLVFYWTLNNIFSLLKNIVGSFGFKFKKPTYFTFSKRNKSFFDFDDKHIRSIYTLFSIYLFVFMGTYVPGILVRSSPTEFVDPFLHDNPVKYLVYSASISAGYFIIWGQLLFALLSKLVRRVAALVMSCCAFISSFMFFVVPHIDYAWQVVLSEGIDICVLILSILLAYLVCKFNKFFTRAIPIIAALAVIAISIRSIGIINSRYSSFDYPENRNEISIELSTNGNNVVVIMLDRAVGQALPMVLDMNPELESKLDGFTFYPNTVSFAGYTNMTTPSLCGGYEYIPQRINERDNESLEEKQNEAISVLPVLFSGEGYEVNVIDPPYAGYEETPEISVFDQYEGVNAYYTGSSLNPYGEEIDKEICEFRERNVFFYSLYRASLLNVAPIVLDSGNYNCPLFDYCINDTVLDVIGFEGMNYTIFNSYWNLKSLPDITTINDDSVSTYTFMDNLLTHDDIVYQQGGEIIDHLPANLEAESSAVNNDLYYVTVRGEESALYLLGEWFDYLRANGVYDNTRIIIVADHGCDYNLDDTTVFEDGINLIHFNPLLLVKDFGSTGFNVSYEFMTNADTPYLAVNGLIDNPCNPFTGAVISDADKYSDLLQINNSHAYNTNRYRGNTYVENDWIYITPNSDSVINPEYWQRDN